MSTRPLLGGDREGNEGDDQDKRSSRGWPAALFGTSSSINLFNGQSTAYEAMCLILNAEDPNERDELTKTWRNHKLEELNFVGTLGALLAGCLSSTSSWPDVLNNGREKPWTVRALWLSGLVFALFSVLIAGLQSMRLHRLSAHRDGLELIRSGLSGRRDSAGRVRPQWLHVNAWEFSLAFLITSVLCMVMGIAVLVWVSTGYGPDKPEDGGWWDENSKMAVTFTIVLGFAMLVLLSSQTALMGGRS